MRVIDPTTGAPVAVADEEHRANQGLKARLSAAEHLRLETEQRVSQEAHARAEAEVAQLVAEQRAARAEAALQEALAALARQRGAPADQPCPPSQAMMMMLGAGRTR